jgi:hypothetical protein
VGYKENIKIKEILSELKLNERLFRVNCGMAWTGKVINKIKNKIVLENPRPFYGMPEGTSDLIGFTSIEITKEMVGNKIAVFTAIEVKTKNVTTSEEQNNFIKMVQDLGGIAKIVKG